MVRRRPIFVIVLTGTTLGLYGLYWFYSTSKQVIAVTGRDSSALLWLVGLFVPIVDLVVLWRYSHAVEEAAGGRRGTVLFLLWLVFFPAAQYVVQKDLNAAADKNPVGL